MTRRGSKVLSQEELRHLLADADSGGRGSGVASDPWMADEDASVSQSGDLATTCFAEVLRGVAGQHGVLRVENPLEEHDIYIVDGVAQDHVAYRHQDRRLGRRMVRSKLITQEQLDGALKDLKKGNAQLGEVLVRKGFLTQEVVDAQLEEQAVEDLYSLFTWSVGRYEFRPGEPAQLEPFADLPRFSIDRVLEEAEPRIEEWARFMETHDGFDGVVLPAPHRKSVHLTASHASVLKALDGKSTLRELAEVTMLGLFDCARAVKDLYDWKMVEAAPPDQLLSIARSRLDEGEVKRASMVLFSLASQRDPADLKLARDLAELLQECGENQAAAECLLTTAETCDADRGKLAIARAAYKIDSRSIEVASFLRNRLLDLEPDAPELVKVTCTLTDALARERRHQDALEVISPVAQPAAVRVGAFARKIRLLCKLDRQQEAVSELLELAAILEKDGGDKAHLQQVYESILRIDSSREDIAAKLAGRKTAGSRTTPIIWAAAALVTLSAGAWFYFDHQQSQRLALMQTEVAELLDQENATAALTRLDGDEEFLAHAVSRDLRSRTTTMLEAQRTQEQVERDQLLAQLALAADHVGLEEHMRALEIYGALLAKPKNKKKVISVAKTRMAALVRRIENDAKRGMARLPPPPDARLDQADKLQRVLRDLDRDFGEETTRAARDVLAVREGAVLTEVLGKEGAAAIVSTAEQVMMTFEQAGQRKKQYLAVLRERGEKSRLGPVLRAAQQHEDEFRFREALDAYGKLIDEYPDQNDGLKRQFVTRRDRCALYVEILNRIEAATAKGDATEARIHLHMLQKHDPRVPFDRLVQLPIAVDSDPPHGVVTVNGAEVGKAPLTCRYVPHEKTRIEVSVAGFVTHGVTITGDTNDRFDAHLPKAADWEVRTTGVIEYQTRPRHAPAAGSAARLMFVSDRSGTITAVDTRSGTRAWKYPTGDLSGLLPAPVVWSDRVLVTSLDGTTRCLDAADASVKWTREGLPCEGAPVLADGKLIAATASGRLVALDPETGKILRSVKLPSGVHTDLVVRGSQVFATTKNGWLVCANAASCEIVWKTRLGEACSAPPCVLDETVVGASVSGRLLAVRRQDGATVWQRRGLGELLTAPIAVGDKVFLATGERLISFAVSDGAEGPTLEVRGTPSIAPTVVGERILVGDRQGRVTVLDVRGLRPCYEIHGRAAVTAFVAGSDGTSVGVAFGDRAIQFFHKLP